MTRVVGNLPALLFCVIAFTICRASASETLSTDQIEGRQLDKRNADDHYRQGNNAFTDGDYEKAIAEFNESLRLDPNQAQVHASRGLVWELKANQIQAIFDYDEAIRLINEAMPLAPNEADVYYERGRVFWLKGDHDLAIADYDEALRLNPKHAKASGAKETAQNSKESQKAISDLKEEVGRIQNPTDAESYLFRSDLMLLQGDYERALADIGKAVELDPKNMDAAALRQTVLLVKGDYDQIITDLDQAISLDPNNSEAFEERGLWQTVKGEFVRAIADYEEAIRLSPKNPSPYNSLAEVLGSCPITTCRNGPKAVEYALQACELNSWESRVYFCTLAAAYAESAKFPEAIKWQEKAVDLAKDLKTDSSESQKEAGLKRLALYKNGKAFTANPKAEIETLRDELTKDLKADWDEWKVDWNELKKQIKKLGR